MNTCCMSKSIVLVLVGFGRFDFFFFSADVDDNHINYCM